ncbi:MAG TPA: MBL fold metallo-hydrolase [Acidimicrobiales bacterium]|nr:MBL fold metallo-hydrolase [Acidimicrobiales bacterium]
MTSAPLAPVVDQLPDGVVHVALPTPFPVGPVNCYLLVDDPVTVVDPGMLWADSTQIIEAALTARGHAIGDVDQVLITHGHPDHFAAAGWLADTAEAAVVCGRAEVPKLTQATDRLSMVDTVDRLGVPTSMRDTFRAFYEGVQKLSHPIDPSRLRVLDDGDTLTAGGRDWQVHVTPGHSVGHVSLYEPGERVLLSGDHLLACITPNPVLEPDPDTVEGRRRSLVEYLASLERFIRLDPLLVLPGHGPRFQDVPTLTEAMRHHHDSRADEILAIVRRLGDATPYELSCELFPHIKDFSVMLGVSEVVGHLDLLEDAGRLVRSDGHPPRYAAK